MKTVSKATAKTEAGLKEDSAKEIDRHRCGSGELKKVDLTAV